MHNHLHKLQLNHTLVSIAPFRVGIVNMRINFDLTGTVLTRTKLGRNQAQRICADKLFVDKIFFCYLKGHNHKRSIKTVPVSSQPLNGRCMDDWHNLTPHRRRTYGYSRYHGHTVLVQYRAALYRTAARRSLGCRKSSTIVSGHRSRYPGTQ